MRRGPPSNVIAGRDDAVVALTERNQPGGVGQDRVVSRAPIV